MLAGVLVAGLGAALTLGLFVLIAAEVVEGSLRGFFGDSQFVEVVFHFFVYLFYFSHRRKDSRGWGFWARGRWHFWGGGGCVVQSALGGEFGGRIGGNSLEFGPVDGIAFDVYTAYTLKARDRGHHGESPTG